MKKIVLFASGSGSNAEKIAEYFANNEAVNIELILSNNPKAGVIDRARKLHIPVVLFDRKTFYETDKIVQLLDNQQITKYIKNNKNFYNKCIHIYCYYIVYLYNQL